MQSCLGASLVYQIASGAIGVLGLWVDGPGWADSLLMFNPVPGERSQILVFLSYVSFVFFGIGIKSGSLELLFLILFLDG